MRYYIYLDRTFLRTLFSSIEDNNFNIEVIEYSVRQSTNTKNNVILDPCFENGCDVDKSNAKIDDEKHEKHNRNGIYSKEKLGISYDYGSSDYLETEKRYINITDITDMKNSNFYHKLIEKIRVNTRATSRICEEDGFIQLLARNLNQSDLQSNEKDKFFVINNICMWYDNNLLDGNIELLSKMGCKIHVIGYAMNCLEKDNNKVAKAIAMFLD